MPATDNGILNLVSGPAIAAGMDMLPRPGQDQEGEPVRAVELEAPDVGRVRITYQLRTYRHGRTRLWHWVAQRADRA